jgi:hypothetical protein
MNAHPGPGEQVFVVAFIAALVSFLMAGLVEVGRRVEKRTGPDSPMPPRRSSPGDMLFQGLSLYLNQPGSRARVRNVCVLIGALALVVCAVAVAYRVHTGTR